MSDELEQRERSWCYEHGCPMNDCMGIHLDEDEAAERQLGKDSEGGSR